MRLFTLLLFLLPAVAHAGSITNGQRVLFLPGTYALRSLCPPAGDIGLTVWDPTDNFALVRSDTVCVNGRIGVTVTIPPGPALFLRVSLDLQRAFANPKFFVERDCAEGVDTTCTLTVNGEDFDTSTATAAGKFTYPADVDWYLFPDSTWPYKNVTITTKPGCFASGKINSVPVVGGFEVKYLSVIGGPSGCGYQITARNRETVPE